MKPRRGFTPVMGKEKKWGWARNLTGFNPIICQFTTLSNLNIKSKNACKNSLNSVIYSIISRTGGGR
jgi:hypothetical protein